MIRLLISLVFLTSINAQALDYACFWTKGKDQTYNGMIEKLQKNEVDFVAQMQGDKLIVGSSSYDLSINPRDFLIGKMSYEWTFYPFPSDPEINNRVSYTFISFTPQGSPQSSMGRLFIWGYKQEVPSLTDIPDPRSFACGDLAYPWQSVSFN